MICITKKKVKSKSEVHSASVIFIWVITAYPCASLIQGGMATVSLSSCQLEEDAVSIGMLM